MAGLALFRCGLSVRLLTRMSALRKPRPSRQTRAQGQFMKGAGTASSPAAQPSTCQQPGTRPQSQLSSVYLLGANAVARLARSEAPTNFREHARRTGRIHFKAAVQSQCDPGVIRAIADLASFIRQQQPQVVGGVLSPADYLLTTRFMLRPTDPQARRLPDTAAEVKLLWNYYGSVLGSRRLHQIVDTNYWQSLTTIFLKDANFVDTARLMDDLRGYECDPLAPEGNTLGFAGAVAVSQALIHGIVTTQIQSLICSLIGIFAVTWLFGGSWRWGFYCLLPSVLAEIGRA